MVLTLLVRALISAAPRVVVSASAGAVDDDRVVVVVRMVGVTKADTDKVARSSTTREAVIFMVVVPVFIKKLTWDGTMPEFLGWLTYVNMKARSEVCFDVNSPLFLLSTILNLQWVKGLVDR